jgi:hypothetical protein
MTARGGSELVPKKRAYLRESAELQAHHRKLRSRRFTVAIQAISHRARYVYREATLP